MSDNYPDLSVVIAVRNGAETLGAQLDALAKERYPGNWELIVVDNGSSDDTWKICKNREHLFSKYHYHYTADTEGPGWARNEGAMLATGELVLFLDADDVVCPGYLMMMGQALLGADLVGASIDRYRLNNPDTWDRRPPVQETELPRFHGFPFVVGATMGVRRRAFLSLGGFDHRMIAQEDIDFSIRAATSGLRIGFVKHACVAYRYRTSSRGTYRQEFSYGRYAARVYRKHRKLFATRRQPYRLRTGVRRWVEVGKWLPLVVFRAARIRFATVAGSAVGHIRGSIEYHVMYF